MDSARRLANLPKLRHLIGAPPSLTAEWGGDSVRGGQTGAVKFKPDYDR
jgi:hypothetical protein